MSFKESFYNVEHKTGRVAMLLVQLRFPLRSAFFGCTRPTTVCYMRTRIRRTPGDIWCFSMVVLSIKLGF